MRKLLPLTILACVPFLVAAQCQTKALTDPCDVLVPISPKPETNTYLVANDRPTAVQIAKHRGRYTNYRCGE